MPDLRKPQLCMPPRCFILRVCYPLAHVQVLARACVITLLSIPGQACKDATNDFARISTSIKEVEEQLKAEGTEDATGLAVWVRKLQGTEKSKLELTIGLQVIPLHLRRLIVSKGLPSMVRELMREAYVCRLSVSGWRVFKNRWT